MSRISKIILGVVIAVVAAAAILLVSVNLWLQSATTQERLRAAVEDALGFPVSVESSFYTPWGGIQLSGLSAEGFQPQRDFFKASAFVMHFDIFPLFSRRFVVSEVALKQPVLTVRETSRGIVVPLPPPPKEVREKEDFPPERPPEAAPPEEDAAKVEAVEQVETVKRDQPRPFEVEIRKISVLDGEMRVFNEGGAPVAFIRGLAFQGKWLPGGVLSATVSATSAQLVEYGLSLKNVKANITADERFVNVEPATADWAGGILEGKGKFESLPEAPFEAEFAWQKVKFANLLTDAGIDPGEARGLIDGTLKLGGNFQQRESIRGEGHVEMVEGRVIPFEFVRQLGQLLRIDELQALLLSEARADFVIRDERVFIEDMTLRTDNVIFKAQGPVHFEGKVKVNARLGFNEKLQRQLGGLLNRNFVETEDLPGYRAVAFEITGTTSRPKTDLLEKATGIRVGGDIGGLLKGFFGQGSQKPAEKKSVEKKTEGDKKKPSEDKP